MAKQLGEIKKKKMLTGLRNNLEQKERERNEKEVSKTNVP